MTVQDDIRQLIDAQRERLRLEIPDNREAAILAIVGVLDRALVMPGAMREPDPVTGYRIANLGGNLALRLCLEADHAAIGPEPLQDVDDWARRFLVACGDLAAAELALSHCESGFMRIVRDAQDSYDAWIATKQMPASWRERLDIDWWARSLPGRGQREMEVGRGDQDVFAAVGMPPDAPDGDRAAAHVQGMVWQFPYPTDAELGGIAIRVWRGVLHTLLDLALQETNRGRRAAPVSARSLAESIASRLGIETITVAEAISGFTLDRETSAWHAAVPGVATAPVIRIGADRIVLSRHGLTTEPFLFLTHELRRRDAAAYHNASYLREVAFRRDLYSLFEDSRFVTSQGRIELRGSDRAPRTDIDAAIFDRKTGTLGVFELKSQDPFARSPGALARQRDNLLQANRQVSRVLDWLNRNGADEVLNRIDFRTAKRFRVRRVLPFVLGRYLVHFDGGPEPSRQAAWGAWPQVLRLFTGQPAGPTDSNPLLSLFTYLRKDDAWYQMPAGIPSRELALGDSRLTVHPSYASLQAHGRRIRGGLEAR